jgi:hypothetical protein
VAGLPVTMSFPRESVTVGYNFHSLGRCFLSIRESQRVTLPPLKYLSHWGETTSREFSSDPTHKMG